MVQGTQELAAHHAVDTSSQRNSDYRLSKIGIVAQSLHFSPPIPSLALILDSLSLEWALTRLQASRLAESIKRIEVAQHYTSHTPSGKPDSDVQHYTHLSHPWGCALGQPVRQASGLVREGGTYLPKDTNMNTVISHHHSYLSTQNVQQQQYPLIIQIRSFQDTYLGSLWLGPKCRWIPLHGCPLYKFAMLYFGTAVFNPLESRGNYSATSNNMKLVHWPLMGELLHLVQRASPPRPLLAVPNITAHWSTASVRITILLYNGPLLCGFNVPIKGLIDKSEFLLVTTADWRETRRDRRQTKAVRNPSLDWRTSGALPGDWRELPEHRGR